MELSIVEFYAYGKTVVVNTRKRGMSTVVGWIYSLEVHWYFK